MTRSFAAAGVLAAALLTSCSDSSGPDPAACKQAMTEQFEYGMAHPEVPEATRPPECQGVADEDLQRFVSEIMASYLGTGS